MPLLRACAEINKLTCEDDARPIRLNDEASAKLLKYDRTFDSATARAADVLGEPSSKPSKLGEGGPVRAAEALWATYNGRSGESENSIALPSRHQPRSLSPAAAAGV
jgi:hypothetical protein